MFRMHSKIAAEEMGALSEVGFARYDISIRAGNTVKCNELLVSIGDSEVQHLLYS
uniref:PDZ domain-containing protein n=1 Tax=Ascaris lumbricoides TaxID=6252 RepID=A0A0M3ILF4_ASCLU